MAIVNPTPADFKNAQKRALDYQQYRSTSDVLRAAAEFYKVSVFKLADNKPLYYITSGLETSAEVVDDKIQITVNKGTAVLDNQPIVFLDDFVFEYDKPSTDTTYYIYLNYKYVEEYPPNYAQIEIYTAPVNDERYTLFTKVNYHANTNEVTVDVSAYEELRSKDIALKSTAEILTARANEIENVLIELKETSESNFDEIETELEKKAQKTTAEVLTARANEIEEMLIKLNETVEQILERLDQI